MAILTCLDNDEGFPYVVGDDHTASAAAKTSYRAFCLTEGIALHLRTRHLNIFNLVLVLFAVDVLPELVARQRLPAYRSHASISIAS